MTYYFCTQIDLDLNYKTDMNHDGRNEIIDMDKNDLYIMRYKPIGNYVNSGEIQLIYI